MAWRDGAKWRLEEEVELRALMRVTCSALPARRARPREPRKLFGGNGADGAERRGVRPGCAGARYSGAARPGAIAAAAGCIFAGAPRAGGSEQRQESHRIKVFERRCFAGVQWIRTRALQTVPRLF